MSVRACFVPKQHGPGSHNSFATANHAILCYDPFNRRQQTFKKDITKILTPPWEVCHHEQWQVNQLSRGSSLGSSFMITAKATTAPATATATTTATTTTTATLETRTDVVRFG